MLVGAAAYAQDSLLFILQSDASFKTEDGKDYIVVEYEGKSQQELFDMFRQRVTSAYKPFTPSKDESAARPLIDNVIDGKAFTVNSYLSQMAETAGSITIHILGKYWACTYSMNLQFKDGRVRINAPVLYNTYIENTKMNTRIEGGHKDLSKWLRDFAGFKKDGRPNPKNEFYISANKRMTEEIKLMLSEQEEEDW